MAVNIYNVNCFPILGVISDRPVCCIKLKFNAWKVLGQGNGNMCELKLIFTFSKNKYILQSLPLKLELSLKVI